MHGVNLDLLATNRHHADGRPRDPHGQHRFAHLAALHQARRQLWHRRLARLAGLLTAIRPALRPARRVVRH
ncbi:hypothetical protein [Tabrizicola soli]|uniref:Uncharacterized protein n=1 Tax=Tabrizicola soli TaxID=2185115 RepID=A0ABV7DNQ9_9RHOB|nr:hypothetical protein [Tabrizicola soli]